MRHQKTSLAVLAMMMACAAPVTSTQAETVLTSFDDFNLDGLFSSWTSATVVSTPTNYSITASGFGSGFKALSPNIDATGETHVEWMRGSEVSVAVGPKPLKAYGN